MPHDPVRVAEVKSWLVKSMKDLQAAEVDLAADPPILEDALFHCQQAVEKTLKAFLVWHDVPFRRTHDIGEVGEPCVALDPTLASFVQRAEPLSHFAWQFRYPGDDQLPPLAEVLEAMALAQEVVQAVTSRLPPETHP